jgi:hypothetical protein
MDPVLVAMCVIVAVFLGYGVAHFAWRSIADRRDGVIAEWEGLRISATELIEGYRPNAKRHPVSGLSASVEECGTERRNVSSVGRRCLHVTIAGPHPAIVRTMSVKCHPKADARARAFAEKVNQASRQLEHH